MTALMIDPGSTIAKDIAAYADVARCLLLFGDDHGYKTAIAQMTRRVMKTEAVLSTKFKAVEAWDSPQNINHLGRMIDDLQAACMASEMSPMARALGTP
ncbi:MULTISPECIES: hypothetical protein [Rhizobium]|uniref:hypothetical protein n=1 Tax=Rhizobium TaxID=379 RepID=UPI0012E3C2B2|nr:MULTISPECIES: hypothetical protein [Rhizobium]